MAWKTDTQASGLDAFNDIISELKSTAFMGAGNEWTELYRQDMLSSPLANSYDRRLTVVLSAPGEAAETIYIGLSFYKDASISNTFFIYPFSFPILTTPYPVASAAWLAAWATATGYVVGNITSRSSVYYVCIQAHTSGATTEPNVGADWQLYWRSINTKYGVTQPNTSTSIISDTTYAIKSWNGEGVGNSVDYWLVADNKRFIIVFKSGSSGSARYHMAYVGALKRFGPIDFNPYPVLMTTNGDKSIYSDSTDQNFYNTRASAAIAACAPSKDWVGGSNIPIHSFGIGDSNVIPDPISGDLAVVESRVHLFDSSVGSEARGVLGTTDGLGAVSNPVGILSEDTLTVGADTWLLIENVYRNVSSPFRAVKLA